MKGIEHMSRSQHGIFGAVFHSPILRIGVWSAVIALGTGCNKGDTPTAPTPPVTGSTIFYTALGASDANGVGSSAECVFLTDCPNGKGYVPVTVRTLTAQGFAVTNRNLGIPTTVIGRDFATLGAQYGRIIVGNMIENEMPFVLPSSTVVTIFAGINEINTITAALGGGAGGIDINGFIDSQVRAFAADYATLAIVRDKDLIYFRTRQLESDGDLADLVHQTAMYHEDRLGGGRFARVVLSGASARGAEIGERLRRGLEERMNVRVEALDFRGTAAMRDRINAGSELLDALAPAVGVILREQVA